jgi:hypothetical protein
MEYINKHGDKLNGHMETRQIRQMGRLKRDAVWIGERNRLHGETGIRNII